jgi:hypothetical protein
VTYILLTGAGFSFNWGGLLASDMFSRLLGSALLDDPLRQMLWKNRENSGGFEDVLAALQVATDADSIRRFEILTSELVGLFNLMGQAFMQRQFEFRDPPDNRYSLASFLKRFDAIFSLNQDTLLEQKYIPFVMDARWGRAHLPGLKYPATFKPTGSDHDRIAIMEPNPSDFKISPGVQPYIKLHGSCNWVEGPSGSRILVMGGQKAVSIGRFPILTWYHQEFHNLLNRAGAKLMVIGYSFSDVHINNAIIDAIKGGSLKIFLVDPLGEKILDKRDPRALIPGPKGELMEVIPPRIIGMSQRPLSSTFDKNTVEHGNLSSFFT